MIRTEFLKRLEEEERGEMHPTPWEVRRTKFGESMGYDSLSAIFDANGNHITTIGTGASNQVSKAEYTAWQIVDAINN